MHKRRYCNDCKKTFSFSTSTKWKRFRHSIRTIFCAVKSYIAGFSPLRTVATTLGVSPATVYSWLFLIASKCKDTIQVAQELKPQWSGYLSIDGKSIFIFGVEYVLLLACDIKTQDIVHAKLVEFEDRVCFTQFLIELKDKIRYPLKAITLDIRRGLISAIRDILPEVPIQACVIHLSRQLDQRLPKGKKKSKFRTKNKILKDLIRKILFANDFEDAELNFWYLHSEEYKFQTKQQRSVIKMIKRNFWLIVTHLIHPGITRDNNTIENIIKQLNRKLKLIGGFRNKESAWAIIKLLILCYRFKAFTNSHDTFFNGKSPLELANCNVKDLDWLHYSQQQLT